MVVGWGQGVDVSMRTTPLPGDFWTRFGVVPPERRWHSLWLVVIYMNSDALRQKAHRRCINCFLCPENQLLDIPTLAGKAIFQQDDDSVNCRVLHHRNNRLARQCRRVSAILPSSGINSGTFPRFCYSFLHSQVQSV